MVSGGSLNLIYAEWHMCLLLWMQKCIGKSCWTTPLWITGQGILSCSMFFWLVELLQLFIWWCFVYVGTNIGADFELSIATDHISFLAATTVSAAACKLLWVGSSCLKTMQEMGPQSALNSSRALDGVHGVYVLPHAPFVVEEVKELGDQSSTCKNSNSGNHRYLLMQWVKENNYSFIIFQMLLSYWNKWNIPSFVWEFLDRSAVILERRKYIIVFSLFICCIYNSSLGSLMVFFFFWYLI